MRGIGKTCIVCLLCLLCACRNNAPINIQEQLDLGHRYLTEMKYEEAIVALEKVIQLEPKNKEALRSLAEVYTQQGRPERAAEALAGVAVQNDRTEEDMVLLHESLSEMQDMEQAAVLAQMVYTATGDQRILPLMFSIKGKQKDYDGIHRLIDDVEIKGEMKDEYLEELGQNLYEDKDIESMQKLSEILNEEKSCEGMSLVMQLLICYDKEGENGVIDLLETYYTDNKKLPAIDDNSEIYIGDRDQQGLRQGFGICYYGNNIKTHSRIYVGNWEQNLRSGDGRAYRAADYRISCQWKEDYPEGEVTILQGNYEVIGVLNAGHVASPMNLYENGEWYAVHCTVDPSKESGYSYQTKTMNAPGNCGHVAKHSYCWDCRNKERE